MTYFDQTRNTDAGFAARISAMTGGVRERFTRYRTYRRTLAELSALTDRELADLGVSPANLREIAHSAAYRN